jgi:hypothetical protein
MAGFEVIIYGRFWVIAEGMTVVRSAEILRRQPFLLCPGS